MKKFKRIISAVLASSCLFSMAALNGNAIMYQGLPVDSHYYADMIDGFEYVDYLSGNGKSVYISGRTMYSFTNMGIEFGATFSEDTPYEEIYAIADELIPDLEYYVTKELDAFWKDEETGEKKYAWSLCLNVYDAEGDPATELRAKELCNAFKEKLDIKSFKYLGFAVEAEECTFLLLGAPEDSLFTVDPCPFYPDPDSKSGYSQGDIVPLADVQAALDDAGFALDAVKVREKLYSIIPREEITTYDMFMAIDMLKEKLGIRCIAGTTAGYFYNDDDEKIGIDMLNSLDGDANCDSTLTIADATAIMQSIGNPDKYGLSDQAKFNADIYNTGDGVTALDALKILRIEAGLE